MINAVGREIPDEILRKMKKPVFTGAYSQKKDVVIRTTAKSRIKTACFYRRCN